MASGRELEVGVLGQTCWIISTGGGESHPTEFDLGELPTRWRDAAHLTIRVRWAPYQDLLHIVRSLVSDRWKPSLHVRGDELVISCVRSDTTEHVNDDGRLVGWNLLLLEWYSQLSRESLSPMVQTAMSGSAAHQVTEQRIQSIRRDADRRVRKIRDSTSYQLGRLLTGAASSPRRLLTLPVDLYRLFRSKGGVRGIADRRRRVRSGEVGHEIAMDIDNSQPRRDITVGCILDEFSATNLAPEFELVNLGARKWRDQVGRKRPDLVVVESAWRPIGGGWGSAISNFDPTAPSEVDALVQWCRAEGVPAVFWNKEDPPNFDVFIELAKKFGYIFTTASEMVEHYRRLQPDATVGVMPFAAQPRIHNPIGSRREGAERVAFAGSWFGVKYPERAEQLRMVLDPALDAGVLDIFDRYASHPDAAKLAFPLPYRMAVKGSLGYSDMLTAYRQYAAFLNVNTVVSSPTMFSRRVFEILACGTPVISTPSRGMEEMLGEHVLLAETSSATSTHIEQMISDSTARDRRGHLGYRHVHSHHTYSVRVSEMLRTVGVEAPPPIRPHVTVVCVSQRPGQLQHAIDSYRRQDYPERDLLFVCNSGEFDLDEVAHRLAGLDARLISLDESLTLGECLNRAMSQARGRYVAKFDDDDDYGAAYLSDMMLTFEYSGAAVAGKASYYAYLEGSDEMFLRFPQREFSYRTLVAGPTLVIDRKGIDDLTFPHVVSGTDTGFLKKCVETGIPIFSADRYNFVMRRSPTTRDHTWRISDEEFRMNTEFVGTGYRAEEIFI